MTYQDIVKELSTSQDDKRKALALSVLGQYASCLGTASPLSPRDFLPYLDNRADVSRLAALALPAGVGIGGHDGDGKLSMRESWATVVQKPIAAEFDTRPDHPAERPEVVEDHVSQQEVVVWGNRERGRNFCFCKLPGTVWIREG